MATVGIIHMYISIILVHVAGRNSVTPFPSMTTSALDTAVDGAKDCTCVGEYDWGI
jgi:hypothetical protein